MKTFLAFTTGVLVGAIALATEILARNELREGIDNLAKILNRN